MIDSLQYRIGWTGLRNLRYNVRIMRKQSLLDALFPRTRQHALAAFTLRADKQWYLSQLASYLEISPSTLQRELASLTRSGIILRRVQHGRAYYKANTECPIICELSDIFLKTIGLADSIRSALQPFASRIDVAFIFGSVARQAQTASSDVDLILIGDVRLVELSPVLAKLEDRLTIPVNAKLYSRSTFARNIAEREHFILSVLDEGSRVYVAGGPDDLARLIELGKDSNATGKQERTERTSSTG